MITKKGISASPGVAIGPALVLDAEDYRIPRRTVEPAQIPQQVRKLESALEAARQELAELRVAAARRLGDKTASIFAFHQEFIADRKLRDAVVELIEKRNFTAAYAFGHYMHERQALFRGVADPYLKARVVDLFDIEKRVLRHILGREREDVTRLTEPVVIVAHEIMPSQALTLDREHILAFALNAGGQTSHMAIMARQQGIPAVVGLTDMTADVVGGETVIVDGTNGIVIAEPDASVLEQYQARQRQDERQEAQLRLLRDLPAVTEDGVAVTLLANIEFAEEARAAIESGAEGIGLYRTEFLFLATDRPPSEEHQFEVFRAAARHMGQRPLVVRTMDLGADKMHVYMGANHDQNPVLGLRSLRYCLQHLDMFKTHLRAILRAGVFGNVRIMFPMISSLIELRQAKAALADVMEDLEDEGIPFRRDMPVGMMIETPAAALQAAAFSREVDFLSIGTNDLTQYTLAVDRGNERVAHLYAPHSPAVLGLIRGVVRIANRARIAVNICGEMAGTPVYCQLLLGMGLRQLSMAHKDIPEIKRIIRSTTIGQCEAIARRALSFDGERQVLSYLRDELERTQPEDKA